MGSGGIVGTSGRLFCASRDCVREPSGWPGPAGIGLRGWSMTRGVRCMLSAVVLSSSMVVAGGCVDERIVFRDRELVGELPAGNAGFVGLSDEERNLTVCGNCHVGYQGDWEQTAHADAWATLEESGNAQEFCEGCHTVNQNGNVAEEDGGWLAVEDTRYHNVQCESCHGPGLTHIQNPGDENVPLAPIAVGLDLTVGCGECHQGAHHPFVDEWEQSAHANIQAYPADRADCEGCHTGEGALKTFGVRAEFLEKEATSAPGEHVAITCAVCHDPHSSEIGNQLRFPIDVPSEEENLCMQCHHKRGTPDLASQSRGPHSPEGPVLLGYGGWWPPNLHFPGEGDTAAIKATHGSAANPRLCAGCHVNAYEATDELTGETIITTGHLFAATPCLVDGQPTGGECEESERSYETCTGAGCHGSAEVARSVRATAELRIANLAEELAALLAAVPATEFNADDGLYTTAEGARFNHQLATWPGSVVHNAFLLEALLIASIEQVEEDYGVAPSSAISLQRELGIDR